jgi:hypothetical protein
MRCQVSGCSRSLTAHTRAVNQSHLHCQALLVEPRNGQMGGHHHEWEADTDLAYAQRRALLRRHENDERERQGHVRTEVDPPANVSTAPPSLVTRGIMHRRAQSRRSPFISPDSRPICRPSMQPVASSKMSRKWAVTQEWGAVERLLCASKAYH